MMRVTDVIEALSVQLPGGYRLGLGGVPGSGSGLGLGPIGFETTVRASWQEAATRQKQRTASTRFMSVSQRTNRASEHGLGGDVSGGAPPRP